jgi:hypothetical protein
MHFKPQEWRTFWLGAGVGAVGVILALVALYLTGGGYVGLISLTAVWGSFGLTSLMGWLRAGSSVASKFAYFGISTLGLAIGMTLSAILLLLSLSILLGN